MRGSARGSLLPLAAPVLQTTLDRRTPDRRGKVRDIYDFGDRLLIIATDRISAFDYVLASGIPDKGRVLARARELTLRLFSEGGAHAASRGIIIADTKFEFGLLPPDGRPDADRLIVIDEMLTPDSSRFWPADSYRPGGPQPSFDKQFVRDYLERIEWNKQPPVPSLPEDFVAKTREKYVEAFERLTLRELR